VTVETVVRNAWRNHHSVETKKEKRKKNRKARGASNTDKILTVIARAMSSSGLLAEMNDDLDAESRRLLAELAA
jgi:hypothetical protein